MQRFLFLGTSIHILPKQDLDTCHKEEKRYVKGIEKMIYDKQASTTGKNILQPFATERSIRKLSLGSKLLP